MIILPDKKIIVVTPPKCGSTSLHDYYSDKGVFVIGPQGPNATEIDKHTTCIPYHYKDFTSVVVIRNPRDRFISLFRHYCRAVEDIEFEEYVEIYRNLHWFYSWTISQLVTSLNHFLTIDIEDFDKTFNVQLPKLHVAWNKKSQGKLIVPDSWIEYDIPKGKGKRYECLRPSQ